MRHVRGRTRRNIGRMIRRGPYSAQTYRSKARKKMRGYLKRHRR